MILKRIRPAWFALLLMPLQVWAAETPNAAVLVENSFKYMRGNASIATVTMTIHRPDWERKMTIKAWTRGKKDSLFYIQSPPKDHGNGTLKISREMWMYNPKINRVIKVPPSVPHVVLIIFENHRFRDLNIVPITTFAFNYGITGVFIPFGLG